MDELLVKCFSFGLTCFFVGRLGHWPRDAASVVLLVQIAQKGGVSEVDGAVVFEPTAELESGPVELIGELR